VTAMSLVSWMWRPAGRLRDIGWGDIALAALLSVWMFLLVSGELPGSSDPKGNVVGGLAALVMTVPVAWERRSPGVAAAVVAVGTVANEYLVGALVRCGPGLPAVLALAFFAATRLDWRRLVVAELLCAGAVITQAWYDPRLGPSFVVAGVPILAVACVAGRLARSRSLAAKALRERNAELAEQREQTARLAVAADRARVAADLDDFLHDRIATMAAAAAAGRELVVADPDAARGAFAAVEADGRQTLTQMREVVGNLRQEELTRPQPVLAQLGSMLETATSADARLHVEGSPRALPAGVELSAYRIVEHLLAAMDDAPDARIDVRLRFGPDALELDVTGPAGRHEDPAAAVAGARERAALLGGTLHIENTSGRCAALVRLPLAPGYASA
jgi:signal transduction histidine kinase